MADTKNYWKEIVTPDDYDAHMVEAGQASVNAALVKEMLSQFPLAEGSILYIPGCGTGQMFDFLKPKELGKLRYLFSDFKPEFLDSLKKRLPADLDYQAVQDDVELSR